MPIPHRPGWYEPNHQHIKEIDLDIRIVPGWSKVPLTAISDLKVSFSNIWLLTHQSLMISVI